MVVHYDEVDREAMSDDFSCFEMSQEADQCGRCIRILVLLIVCIAIPVCLWWSPYPLAQDILWNAIPCIVMMVLALVPDGFPKKRRQGVRFLVAISGFFIGTMLSFLSTSTDGYNVGIAIAIAACYTGIGWWLSEDLCNDKCREQLVNFLEKYCSCAIALFHLKFSRKNSTPKIN